MKFYIGDSGSIEPEMVEIQMQTEAPRMTDALAAYVSAERSASATFELTDPAWEYVKDWSVGEERDVTLTYQHTIVWSRWRRWLNAVLRFAWWPLGPARLQASYEVEATFTGMSIEQISGGKGLATTVHMTTRPKDGATYDAAPPYRA